MKRKSIYRKFCTLALSLLFMVWATPSLAFVVTGLNENCCPHPGYECCDAEGLCAGEDCGPAETTPAPGVCTTDAERRLIGESICVPTGEEAAGSTDSGSSASTIQPRNLPNPLGTSDLREVIARVITIMTSIAGSIALLMFVYGGVLWMTSGGSSEKIESGKKAVVWATIGLFIIFGSYAILRVIFRALGAGL